MFLVIGIEIAFVKTYFQTNEVIMKKTTLSVAIALLATSATTNAAEDDSFYGLTPSASVALTTDYMWRGVSQTNNDPAIQGSFDLSHESGLYVGAWASNVEFGDMASSMELDVYGGFANETDFGGALPFAIGYDVGILRYEFSGLADGAALTELYFGGSISPVENLNISTYYYYGLKIEDHSNPGEYTDIAVDYTLPDSLGGITLLAHAGYYNQKNTGILNGDDYWDWKIGVAKDIAGFNFEVAYHDTDNVTAGSAFGSNRASNDGRVVATISRALGEDHGSAMLPDGFTSSASVALTTDYVWRGVSQTNNEPAIQGSFDIAHDSGAYIGVWGSNVEYGDSSSLELDLYAGFANEIDLGGIAIGYDVGWLHYEFPSVSPSTLDEIYAGLSVSPVANLNLSAYYYYGLDINSFRPGEYTDMAIDYTLPEELGAITLIGHAGYYNQKDLSDDTWDWKAGIARDFGAFNVEVAYTETDNAKDSNINDGRAVATLSTSF